MSLVLDFNQRGVVTLGQTTPPSGDRPEDENLKYILSKPDPVTLQKELMRISKNVKYDDIPQKLIANVRHHIIINPEPGCNPDFEYKDYWDYKKMNKWFYTKLKEFQHLFKSFIIVSEYGSKDKKIHWHIMARLGHDSPTFKDSTHKTLTNIFKAEDSRSTRAITWVLIPGKKHNCGMGKIMPYKEYMFKSYIRKDPQNRNKALYTFYNKTL